MTPPDQNSGSLEPQNQPQTQPTNPVEYASSEPVYASAEPVQEVSGVLVQEPVQNNTPPIEPPQPKNTLLSKLNMKFILLGLAGLSLLGLVIFLVLHFLPTKVPEQVSLTYWGLWEENETIQPLIDEFEATHPNVKINYQKQAKEDYRERLINSFAQGQGPDIFRFHNTWVPMLGAHLSVLPPEVFDPGEYQKTFYPVASRDLIRGADIVGIPLMFDGLALYINEDIFNAAGKSVPVTWDDLRKVAKELTIEDASQRITQSGVALGRTDNVDHWEDILSLMMLQNDVDMKNPIDKKAQDSLSFFTLFSTSDRIWDETMPPSTQAFAGGKLAMYFAPSWRAAEIKTLNPALHFKVYPVPQLPKTDLSQTDTTWASYWAEGVWTKSKSQTIAWEFVKFLSQKDALSKIYTTAAATRPVGPIYPRVDMTSLLQNDPLAGPFVVQAPISKSWYLASRTFDGPTGINSRIAKYYQDAVNSIINDRKEPIDVLPTVAAGINQVLSDYNR